MAQDQFSEPLEVTIPWRTETTSGFEEGDTSRWRNGCAQLWEGEELPRTRVLPTVPSVRTRLQRLWSWLVEGPANQLQ